MRWFRTVPVYHMTTPRNAGQILQEGLFRMKRSERPQSMQVVDELFSDIGEKEFGITAGRKRIFAWPLRSKIEKDLQRARAEWGDQVVLELQVHPKKARVTNQDCASVARELIVSAVKRLVEESIRQDKEIGHPFPGMFIQGCDGRDILHWRRDTTDPAFRHFLEELAEQMPRLELLARTYWTLLAPLEGFDERKMMLMHDYMLTLVSKFPSLEMMLGGSGDYTNAEVIVFEDKIAKRKIRILDI